MQMYSYIPPHQYSFKHKGFWSLSDCIYTFKVCIHLSTKCPNVQITSSLIDVGIWNFYCVNCGCWLHHSISYGPLRIVSEGTRVWIFVEPETEMFKLFLSTLSLSESQVLGHLFLVVHNTLFYCLNLHHCFVSYHK